MYPAVIGAETQVCPHCGHETAPAAIDDPLRARLVPADPVGAVQTAARVARREYPRLLLLWIPALFIEIGVGLATRAYERSAGLAVDPSAMSTGMMMQYLGVALPLVILQVTARIAMWTFVAARTLDVVLGGARLRSWRKLLGPAIVAGFVLTCAYFAGALLLLVGFLVFFHWFAYVPAFVAQGASLGAAFDRSRRFAQERRTQGFTALMLVAGGGIALLWWMAASLPAPQGVVVPAIVNWAFGPVVPLLAASYVAIASHPKPQPEPEPAVPYRASTKCPDCGTLIPYTPTGSAVDVVCPSCGKAGRVL